MRLWARGGGWGGPGLLYCPQPGKQSETESPADSLLTFLEPTIKGAPQEVPPARNPHGDEANPSWGRRPGLRAEAAVCHAWVVSGDRHGGPRRGHLLEQRTGHLQPLLPGSPGTASECRGEVCGSEPRTPSGGAASPGQELSRSVSAPHHGPCRWEEVLSGRRGECVGVSCACTHTLCLCLYNYT